MRTTPRAGCVREIAEETGLSESDLVLSELRDSVLSQKGTEIRQQFGDTGQTRPYDLGGTSEGTRLWDPHGDIVVRQSPYTHTCMRHQYFKDEASRSEVLAGVASTAGQRQWVVGTPLQDWACPIPQQTAVG